MAVIHNKFQCVYQVAWVKASSFVVPKNKKDAVML